MDGGNGLIITLLVLFIILFIIVIWRSYQGKPIFPSISSGGSILTQNVQPLDIEPQQDQLDDALYLVFYPNSIRNAIPTAPLYPRMLDGFLKQNDLTWEQFGTILISIMPRRRDYLSLIYSEPSLRTNFNQTLERMSAVPAADLVSKYYRALSVLLVSYYAIIYPDAFETEALRGENLNPSVELFTLEPKFLEYSPQVPHYQDGLYRDFAIVDQGNRRNSICRELLMACIHIQDANLMHEGRRIKPNATLISYLQNMFHLYNRSIYTDPSWFDEDDVSLESKVGDVKKVSLLHRSNVYRMYSDLFDQSLQSNRSTSSLVSLFLNPGRGYRNIKTTSTTTNQFVWARNIFFMVGALNPKITSLRTASYYGTYFQFGLENSYQDARTRNAESMLPGNIVVQSDDPPYAILPTSETIVCGIPPEFSNGKSWRNKFALALELIRPSLRRYSFIDDSLRNITQVIINQDQEEVLFQVVYSMPVSQLYELEGSTLKISSGNASIIITTNTAIGEIKKPDRIEFIVLLEGGFTIVNIAYHQIGVPDTIVDPDNSYEIKFKSGSISCSVRLDGDQLEGVPNNSPAPHSIDINGERYFIYLELRTDQSPTHKGSIELQPVFNNSLLYAALPSTQ